MHPHDVRWIFNEVIAQLADVHQTVLVHPDINECAKGGDIGNNPGQPESGFEVLKFADAFRKRENLKLLSRVAPRLSELIHDVGQGRKPDRISDVLIESDAFTQRIIAHQIADRTTSIRSHPIDNRVTLRMYRARIKRMRAIADA